MVVPLVDDGQSLRHRGQDLATVVGHDDEVLDPHPELARYVDAQLDHGYCSDCTRTVAAGQVNDGAREIYGLVLDAQLAAVEAVKAGAAGRAVDAVARSAIQAAGHGEHFGHGLGHGVGLEVHEAPRLAQRSDAVLLAGNVVTVEPGVYLPGELGVRIEDLVVVTDDGREILTSVSKVLTVVD